MALIQTPDSSVLIPALQVGHPNHEEARKVLSRMQLRITGHVELETFAAMSSAAYKPRTSPSAAARHSNTKRHSQDLTGWRPLTRKQLVTSLRHQAGLASPSAATRIQQ